MDQDDIDNTDNTDELYLYECNLYRDIENNIGEVQPPEFTMEDIIFIDEKYKLSFDTILARIHQESNTLDELTNIFELNELYMEHTSNIGKLISMMNKYNANYKFVTLNTDLTPYDRTIEYMNVRYKQIEMYLQEILPILQKDEDNYNSFMELQ
jgi:hypothetical protein